MNLKGTHVMHPLKIMLTLSKITKFCFCHPFTPLLFPFHPDSEARNFWKTSVPPLCHVVDTVGIITNLDSSLCAYHNCDNF